MTSIEDSLDRFLAALPNASRRHELTRAFHESLPSDAAELRRTVVHGVWQTVWVSYDSPLKSQYGQLGAGKAARLCQLWRRDPDTFERTRPAAVVAAVRQFAEDEAVDQARFRLAWQQALDEQLPSPPPGYEWQPDNGGLRPPGMFTFRLWGCDMGFMPGSE
jgi:hypothetical protein